MVKTGIFTETRTPQFKPWMKSTVYAVLFCFLLQEASFANISLIPNPIIGNSALRKNVLLEKILLTSKVYADSSLPSSGDPNGPPLSTDLGGSDHGMSYTDLGFDAGTGSVEFGATAGAAAAGAVAGGATVATPNAAPLSSNAFASPGSPTPGAPALPRMETAETVFERTSPVTVMSFGAANLPPMDLTPAPMPEVPATLTDNFAANNRTPAPATPIDVSSAFRAPTREPAALAQPFNTDTNIQPGFPRNPVNSYVNDFDRPYQSPVDPFKMQTYSVPQVQFATQSPKFDFIQMDMHLPKQSDFINPTAMAMVKPLEMPKFSEVKFEQIPGLDSKMISGFDNIYKPNLDSIKFPEPAKSLIGQEQFKPYFEKDMMSGLSPVKMPNFVSLDSQFSTPMPQLGALNPEFNTAIKPTFIKIDSFDFVNNQYAPQLKPIFVPIEPVKTLQLSFDSGIGKFPAPLTVPIEAMPFYLDNFKPGFESLKSPEALKPALGQMPLDFNKIPELVFEKQIVISGNTTFESVKMKEFYEEFKVVNQLKDVEEIKPMLPSMENKFVQLKDLPFKNIDFEKINPSFESLKISNKISPKFVEINTLVFVKDISYAALPLEQASKPQLPQKSFDLAEAMTQQLMSSMNVQVRQDIKPKVATRTRHVQEALRPKTSLVDNYMQKMRTVYEWQKMHNELIALSRNAEFITDEDTGVQLTELNANIIKVKEKMDLKAPEVKNILRQNLIERSVIESLQRDNSIRSFPIKPSEPIAVNKELPTQWPTGRSIPALPNAPMVLPQMSPVASPTGFLQGLRESFKGNVFARSSDDYYPESSQVEINDAVRLQGRAGFSGDHSGGIK